ncbi:MAG: preprotein translocase subunit YajC [Alphaproteobacteria bacterium]|jgi:preprotein translocase subunit YajC
MLISPAYAQDAAAGGGFGGIEQLLPLVLIFVVFYFLLIRPQQKKLKQHKRMVSELGRGDKVITAGGLHATVVKVEDDEQTVVLEIADKVRVKAERSTISGLASKPQPRGANDDSVVKKS